MTLIRKIETFSKFSRRVKLLVFEAVLISAYIRFTFLFLPFKAILNRLGQPNVESINGADPGSQDVRNDIKTAVILSSRYSPWKTTCYTQALTAKILLNKYSLPSTIYIGFNKNEKEDYKGHAWLRSYDTILTGDKEVKNYVIQSFFT